MNNTFYLSLGSNIGQREQFIRSALDLLRQHTEQIKLGEVSSFYETDPVGYEEQPAFLNIAVKGQTALTPEELLRLTQRIEHELGRTREVHWGPRVIDIDILLYNSIRMDGKDLVLPHPRMMERAFVLVPLAEIEPDLILPEEGHSVKECLHQVGKEGVRLWKTN